MSSLNTKTPDVMRSAAGLHRHNTGAKALQKAQQPVSLKPFAKHNRPRFVQSRKAADGLAQINAQNVDVHQNALLHLCPQQ